MWFFGRHVDIGRCGDFQIILGAVFFCLMGWEVSGSGAGLCTGEGFDYILTLVAVVGGKVGDWYVMIGTVEGEREILVLGAGLCTLGYLTGLIYGYVRVVVVGCALGYTTVIGSGVGIGSGVIQVAGLLVAGWII